MNNIVYTKERIESGSLLKHWERDYSVFFCAALGESYKIANSPEYGEGALTLSLITYVNGVGRYYRLIDDNDKFLRIISQKMINDSALLNTILQNYEKAGEKMLNLFEQIKEGADSYDFAQILISAIVDLVAPQLYRNTITSTKKLKQLLLTKVGHWLTRQSCVESLKFLELSEQNLQLKY